MKITTEQQGALWLIYDFYKNHKFKDRDENGKTFKSELLWNFSFLRISILSGLFYIKKKINSHYLQSLIKILVTLL